MRGRGLVGAGLRAGLQGAGPTPAAGGVRSSAPPRAAGAAELELEPERQSRNPGLGRSGLHRHGVCRLQAELPEGGDPADHQDAGAPGGPSLFIHLPGLGAGQ